MRRLPSGDHFTDNANIWVVGTTEADRTLEVPSLVAVGYRAPLGIQRRGDITRQGRLETTRTSRLLPRRVGSHPDEQLFIFERGLRPCECTSAPGAGSPASVSEAIVGNAVARDVTGIADVTGDARVDAASERLTIVRLVAWRADGARGTRPGIVPSELAGAVPGVTIIALRTPLSFEAAAHPVPVRSLQLRPTPPKCRPSQRPRADRSQKRARQ